MSAFVDEKHPVEKGAWRKLQQIYSKQTGPTQYIDRKVDNVPKQQFIGFDLVKHPLRVQN